MTIFCTLVGFVAGLVVGASFGIVVGVVYYSGGDERANREAYERFPGERIVVARDCFAERRAREAGEPRGGTE